MSYFGLIPIFLLFLTFPFGLQLDNVFRSLSQRVFETVRVHSNGDSGNDSSLSASNLPLPQTHQPCLSVAQLGLHFPCSWCLY